MHVTDAALSANVAFGILLGNLELELHVASLALGSGGQRCGCFVGGEGGDVTDSFLDLSVGDEFT